MSTSVSGQQHGIVGPLMESAPPDLLGLLATLLNTTPDRLSRDTAPYRAQVERVRAAVARLREVASDPRSDATARAAAEAELRSVLTATGDHATAPAADRSADFASAVRALGVQPDHIAAGLRTITTWLEQKTPAAGAAVDAMVAALEAIAAPFLDRLGSPDAERDERLRTAVRTSIASRLKAPSP